MNNSFYILQKRFRKLLSYCPSNFRNYFNNSGFKQMRKFCIIETAYVRHLYNIFSHNLVFMVTRKSVHMECERDSLVISINFHLHPISGLSSLSPVPRRPSHFQFPPRFPFPASGLLRLTSIIVDTSVSFHWSSQSHQPHRRW